VHVPARVAVVLSMVAGVSLPLAAADLKASFAFNDRMMSMVLPSLDYRIYTTVEEDNRKITILYPRPRSAEPEQTAGPVMGIIMIALLPQSGARGFLEDNIRTFLAATGGAEVQAAGVEFSLLGGEHIQANLLYTDSQTDVHEVSMVASAEDQMGILVIVDSPIESYDAIEGASASMIESIHFEY
jgi:hypothetical protein